MASLYLRRSKVVDSLAHPERFSQEAYVLSALGYIISTPLGFSDVTSPLPNEEELRAEEFCKEEKEPLAELIPYVYYLPYSLQPDLCNCLKMKVSHLLLCDPFTKEVLLSYLLDFVYRRANFPPTYRLLETVFFCSGRPKMVKEAVEPLPPLDEESLTDLLRQLFATISFLWRELRFVATLSLEELTYKAPYFKLGSLTTASVILQGVEGLYLLDSQKRKPSVIYLEGESPYYYYSPQRRHPGSWSFYSLLFSLLLVPSLRELFFTSPLGKELWRELFPEKHQEELILKRIEKGVSSLEELTNGVKLKCALNLLSPSF